MIRMLRGSRWFAALLASAALVAPALAQPKSPSEKDKRIAGDLVKKAIAKSQAGDHETAIVTYLQAYTIVPNSVLLSNIGSEYQQGGKPEEALRYFCMYLEKDPTGTNAPYATQQAKQLQIQLGNMSDGVCAPPEPEPAPKAPAPAPSEAAEPKPAPAPQASSAGGGSRALRYGGIAAGVTGLAGLGLGVYAGLQARDISDEITDHDPSQPWGDIKDLERRGQRYEALQIAGLIAGGVLVTGGVIMFVVGRPSGSSGDARDKASVGVAPTRNGLAVFGRF